MAATPSLKRLQIDKTTSRMVVVAAAAVFIVIFVLVSGHTLVSQMSYQNRVISAKQKALNQLKQDISANKQLVTAYKAFVGTPQNLIGGSTTGTGANDGDNGKIILDALPSQYDFPALTTSVQELLSSQGVNIDSISGTDEQASVSGGGSSSSSSSSSTTTTTTTTSTESIGNAVPMPFQFTVDGPYANIQNVVTAFAKSIRPFQFLTMQLSGDESDLTLTVSAQSFYQPAQNFKITMENVK